MILNLRGAGVWLCLAVAGCSGSATVADGSGGGGAGPTGPGGGPSGPGSGGGGACSAYRDQEGLATVTVRVENKGAAAVHFGTPIGCEGMRIFDVVDGKGATLVHQPGLCTFTCEDLQHDVNLGCPAVCAFASVVKLGPGGTYEASWDGTHYAQASMPASCYADGGGNTVDGPEPVCLQKTAAAPGTYTAEIEIRELDCSMSGPPDCACEPGAQGWCMAYVDEAATKVLGKASAGFTLPTQTTVTIAL
jgi:hypothetical protein